MSQPAAKIVFSKRVSDPPEAIIAFAIAMFKKQEAEIKRCISIDPKSGEVSAKDGQKTEHAPVRALLNIIEKARSKGRRVLFMINDDLDEQAKPWTGTLDQLVKAHGSMDSAMEAALEDVRGDTELLGHMMSQLSVIRYSAPPEPAPEGPVPEGPVALASPPVLGSPVVALASPLDPGSPVVAPASPPVAPAAAASLPPARADPPAPAPPDSLEPEDSQGPEPSPVVPDFVASPEQLPRTGRERRAPVRFAQGVHPDDVRMPRKRTPPKRVRTSCNCENCIKEDCGECHYCRNMTKFGGTGTLRKRCQQRKCLTPGTGQKRRRKQQEEQQQEPAEPESPPPSP
ncbi:MAG: CXXC-type zinc finger protein, partial [Pseudomonadota bacterium]|nr:CXXC-type zinc finger protein [Pseudomonadota bacterium]